MAAMGGMPMPGGWTMSIGVDADARTDVARRRGIVPRKKRNGGPAEMSTGALLAALI